VVGKDGVGEHAMMTVEQANAIHATKFVKAETAKKRWLLFFGVLLPLAFAVFALLAEGAAYALHGIQPFRTSLDKIVVAAERVPGNAQWLIFGDSLTQHVLMDYALGPPSAVANLTTHAGAGMPSMYLLLQRYLATHAKPKAIILAMSPETLSRVPDAASGSEWLTSTFLRPEEQLWLSQFYPSARVHGWIPAVFDLKETIFDPMTGLFAPKADKLITGPAHPEPGVATEAPVPLSELRLSLDAVRIKDHLKGRSARPVLTDICHLARQYGFAVHVIITPVPSSVRDVWEERGDLARLKEWGHQLMMKECGPFSEFDMSQVIKPNFDDGGTHIVGTGWENRYALALKYYMQQFDGAGE
jgi:hypothetical protein